MLVLAAKILVTKKCPSYQLLSQNDLVYFNLIFRKTVLNFQKQKLP